MGSTTEITTPDGKVNMSMFWLAIHCARCIAYISGENTHLAINTFDENVREVVPFTRLDATGIASIDQRLHQVLTAGPQSTTNMFGAIKSVKAGPSDARCVTILLTDGQPDAVSGYHSLYDAVVDFHSAKGLRALSGSLHTIAFGNNVNSKLLQNLSRLSKGGRFFHAPSQNEIGPLVVNLVASELLVVNNGIELIAEMTDGSLKSFSCGPFGKGQPRHITIPNAKSVSHAKTEVPVSKATIPFLPFRQAMIEILQAAIITYDHECSSGRKPMASPEVEKMLKNFHETHKETSHEGIKDLLLDIVSPNPNQGQLVLASRYMNTWGEPYMRAYLDGLFNCVPFNNMDPGLLQFIGAFMTEKRRICQLTMLDVEPWPLESRYGIGAPSAAATQSAVQTVMTGAGGCFAPGTLVTLPVGTKPIEQLERGDTVLTPSGPATVLYVLEASSYETKQKMCQLSKNLLITEYHPVVNPLTGEWDFPRNIIGAVEMEMPTVYNLVLNHGHSIIVDNTLCCTLAHGFKGPIIEHPFFGTTKVIDAMRGQPGFDEGRPVYKNMVAIREGNATGPIIGWIDMI
jgi:hypothetical protein